MKRASFERFTQQLPLGHIVAVLSVIAALVGISLMQALAGFGSGIVFLIAVAISTWIGGAKPGLLAIALSLLGFDYYLRHLSGSSIAVPIQALRLLALAATGGFVVWVTASERGVSNSLRAALKGLSQTNDALQIENAERLRVEAELRESEATFRALLESAPMPIVIFQADKIRYANPATARVTGYSTDELYTMNFWDTAHADFRDLVKQRGLGRQRGEPTPPRYELKIVTKSGEERWVDFTDGQFESNGKPAVVGVIFDITERKRAEEAVRESRQLLNLVLATLPVGVAVTNRTGDIVLANRASSSIWKGDVIIAGHERWAKSKGFWHASGERIAPEEWPSVQALSQGQTSVNELIDIETFDGGQKTIQNSTAPIRNEDGGIVGAVIVNEDVTERVRAETALHESAHRLQQLSRRLLKVQEEERRNLSRELHDEFGQLLATIALHLHAAKAVAGPAALTSLQGCMALLQRAGAEVRNLALELRPTMLETAGLDATLRWLAEQHHQSTGMAIEVSGHSGEVSAELAIACFRVVQEALTNVVRHANARRVWIELSQAERLLQVVIRDDGVGFDVLNTLDHAANRGRLGLVGMRERVEILGGDLAVESQSGQGARICVSLPVAASIAAVTEHAA